MDYVANMANDNYINIYIKKGKSMFLNKQITRKFFYSLCMCGVLIIFNMPQAFAMQAYEETYEEDVLVQLNASFQPLLDLASIQAFFGADLIKNAFSHTFSLICETVVKNKEDNRDEIVRWLNSLDVYNEINPIIKAIKKQIKSIYVRDSPKLRKMQSRELRLHLKRYSSSEEDVFSPYDLRQDFDIKWFEDNTFSVLKNQCRPLHIQLTTLNKMFANLKKWGLSFDNAELLQRTIEQLIARKIKRREDFFNSMTTCIGVSISLCGLCSQHGE